MANNVSVTANLQVNSGTSNSAVSRSFNIAPAGTNYHVGTQNFNTGASTVNLGACSTLEYIAICNPSTNTVTATVTVSAMILKPGYVALFPPSSVSVTVQPTASLTGMAIATTES